MLSVFAGVGVLAMAVTKPPLDAAQAERFARLALACVHREYPNKIAHALNGDEDVKPPREHYEGGHWLGTFAVYLLTRRGL